MSKVWLIGAAVFVAILLIASLLVALLKGEEELEEGTPGRTVQLHFQAVKIDDYKAAQSLLSGELRKECSVGDYTSQNISAAERFRDSRVTLEETKDSNGEVVVVARVSRIRSKGPFGTSESSHRQTFSLVSEGNEWRFSKYPWPLGCRVPFDSAVPPRDLTSG